MEEKSKNAQKRLKLNLVGWGVGGEWKPTWQKQGLCMQLLLFTQDK